ncbi:ISAs1 family transposase [Streptomyces erythrochromogenes]|uniref:ISAs1 family transposase n=1 Tax=Streptomyces erythrochromogenes TaxID=285574 RepID=UPI0036B39921
MLTERCCDTRAPAKSFCSPVTWGYAGGRGAQACSGPVGWGLLRLTVRPGDHARAMSSSLVPAPVRMPVPHHELLVQLLVRVPDPRGRRGVRHPVGALIAVAVCAVVAGARGFTAIGEWARDAGSAALQRLGLERGGVDESTLRRLFARLDADRPDAVLGAWALARAVLVAGRRVIAIDGKTVRGARGGGSSAPHLVAALAHVSGAVLGQVAVGEKSNEIPAARELLQLLDLDGLVVRNPAEVLRPQPLK